jgi:hypothetical protein
VGTPFGMIYDSIDDQLVALGGSAPYVNGGGPLIDSVWTMPLGTTGAAWTAQIITGTPPTPAVFELAVFDSSQHRVIVPFETIPPSIWSLRLDPPMQWTNITPTGLGPQYLVASAMDARRGRLLLLAEELDSNHRGTESNLWSVPLSGAAQWSRISSDHVAPPRSGQSLLIDDAHNRILMFGGSDDSGTHNDIWALSLDAPVPALVSLTEADATSGGITLRWYSPSAVTDARVERRGNGGWLSVGQPDAWTAGELRFVDHDVVRGADYVYRLAYTDDGSQAYTPETRVHVPGAPALSLESTASNPARGRLVVKLSLPSAAPARVELYDLNGRRVTTRMIGAGGPATRIEDLGGAPSLRAGVYFVRLSQGHDVVTRRIALTE